MKLLSMLALLPFLALSYQPAHAAPAEDASVLPWSEYTRDVAVPEAGTKLLATFRVGARIDTFRIAMSNCGKDVQAVELKVQGANVTVQTFGIRFTDGSTREFNVNKTFSAGTDSGWIDLGMFRAMDQRCPTDVYAKANATGNATVLVYGNVR